MREFLLFFLNPKINGKVFFIISVMFWLAVLDQTGLPIIKESSPVLKWEMRNNNSRCHGSTENKIKKIERQPISNEKHCKNRKSTSNKCGKEFNFLVVSLKAKEVKFQGTSVLFVINTMLWLHRIPNDFQLWKSPRVLTIIYHQRRTETVRAFVFFSENKKTRWLLIWLNRDVSLFEKLMECVLDFRHNRVENFQFSVLT